MARIGMPRSSYLLNFCSFFAVVASLQVLTSWAWADFDSSNWKVAWCDSTAPPAHWVLAYSWAVTGVIVGLHWIKGDRTKAYRWVIISFAMFWIIAMSVASHSDRNDSDAVGLLVFLGLMIWSFRRFRSRLTETDQGGAGEPLTAS